MIKVMDHRLGARQGVSLYSHEVLGTGACEVGYVLTTDGRQGRLVVPDARCGITLVEGQLWWFGPSSRPWLPPRPQVSVLGVRIGLVHGRSVAGSSLDRWRDRQCPLAQLWGSIAVAELEQRLMGADDGQAAVRLIAEAATTQALERPAAPRTRRLVKSLIADHTIVQIAQEMSLSTRQVHRQCVADFGLTPMLMRRILRLQHAATMWGSGQVPTHADLALHMRYYDQPHLIRDFRALAGETPRTALG